MPDINLVEETAAPKYTKADENSFLARLEPFKKNNPKHPIIPVTKHPDLLTLPGPKPNGNSKLGSRPPQNTSCGCLSHSFVAHVFKADIVTALFAHICAADTTAISHLIRDQGLISPDCPTAEGETPLLAAIRARSAPTVRTLIALGADPNLPGTPAPAAWDGSHLQNVPKARGRGRRQRQSQGGGITPLMLASATGQLAIVKLLLNDFAADESVVGPRGETALWLAAKSGHREVVAFLPTRRSGAWKRLKHSKEAARLKKVVVTAGRVGKCLGYTVPRALVYDIPRAVGRFAWRRRWRVWGLVVRAVKGLLRSLGEVGRYVFFEMPQEIWGMVLWIAKAVPRALKGLPRLLGEVGRYVFTEVPRNVWRLVVWIVNAALRALKGLSRFLRKLGRFLGELGRYVFTEMPRDIWRVVLWISRAVTRASEVLWRAVLDGLRKVGGAVAYAAQRVVSALHSFFVAVVGFLREVKLRDLGHDLLVAMKALLVKLPGAVLTFVVQLPAALKRAVKACFKNDWVKCLLSVAFALVFLLPRTLWKLLESLWACFGRGLEELISLINPKMVSSRKSRS